MDERAQCSDERARKAIWTQNEDMFILGAVRRFGTQWAFIAQHLPGRSEDAVRNRWHRLKKMHLTDGPIAMDFEEAVRRLDVPQITAKSAADRSRAPWSAEEDQIILEGVRLHGFKWRLIVSALPGRSDSSARNRWLRLQKEQQELTPHATAEMETEEKQLASRVPTEHTEVCAIAVPSAPYTPAMPTGGASYMVPSAACPPVMAAGNASFMYSFAPPPGLPCGIPGIARAMSIEQVSH